MLAWLVMIVLLLVVFVSVSLLDVEEQQPANVAKLEYCYSDSEPCVEFSFANATELESSCKELNSVAPEESYVLCVWANNTCRCYNIMTTTLYGANITENSTQAGLLCVLGLCSEKPDGYRCIQIPLANIALRNNKSMCGEMEKWCNSDTEQQLGIRCKYNEQDRYCQCTIPLNRNESCVMHNY
jgi:hypothetical protein